MKTFFMNSLTDESSVTSPIGVWDDDHQLDPMDDDSDTGHPNPYFSWSPKTHYSVIILNDRLMSETLVLSEDDNNEDDERDDRERKIPAKRRSPTEDEDSADSDRREAKNGGKRSSKGHSLNDCASVQSNRNSVDEDIDLQLLATQEVSSSVVTTKTTTKTTTSTLAALLNAATPSFPPTPPSSQCGSDSENHAFRIGEIRRKSGLKTLPTASSPSLISIQPKNAIHGTAVLLTEEEKRTLVAEGYPIPQRFPLTKSEERSLKKIRRKIKNKISAQESRRKKKEYLEELERRVQALDSRVRELERENIELKEKI